MYPKRMKEDNSLGARLKCLFDNGGENESNLKICAFGQKGRGIVALVPFEKGDIVSTIKRSIEEGEKRRLVNPTYLYRVCHSKFTGYYDATERKWKAGKASEP
uniref:Uncharacterized protein n=1 Tax=Ditylenchus dipsaci TaxID=166011 RepID=A0A915EIK1_9BILA